jgi:hypothetical protein
MIYNDNDLRLIALQYKTRKDFERQKQGAYHCAINRGPFINQDGTVVIYSKHYGSPKSLGLTNTFGFINEICRHMIPQGNLYKRVIYAYKFYDENNNKSSAYIGLTCNTNKRNIQHIGNTAQKSAVKKFIDSNPTFRYEFEVLTNFLSPDVAGKIEDEYIKKFKDEGWIILNIAKGGCLGGNTEIPVEELRKVISKYVYYKDLIKYDENTYKTICRRGLLNELTKDLLKTDKRKYTDEDIINSSLECGSYNLFKKQYGKTKYQQAYRRGLLNKIRKLLEQ